MSESKVTKHLSAARRRGMPNLKCGGEKTEQHVYMPSPRHHSPYVNIILVLLCTVMNILQDFVAHRNCIRT